MLIHLINQKDVWNTQYVPLLKNNSVQKGERVRQTRLPQCDSIVTEVCRKCCHNMGRNSVCGLGECFTKTGGLGAK